jgi:uncharacterized protein (TIGR03437 family)
MMRGFFALVLTSAMLSSAGSVQTLPRLPDGTATLCVQTDLSGNLYFGGSAGADGFIEKRAPDGATVSFRTTLTGAPVTAIATGPNGDVFATGTTASSKVPVTPKALQTALGATQQAFAVRLDPTGKIQYATYLGGSALVSGHGIAVDPANNAFVTGWLNSSGFPVSAGAVTGYTGDPNPGWRSGFVVKLDPAGASAPVSIAGFGGDAIALNPDGSIVVAGSLTGPAPTTAGALQSGVENKVCGSNFILGMFPCFHLHVAKIDAKGTKLIFGTYLSGYWGASAAGLAIDADQNVVVAGATNSPDFPTTPSAYLPQYLFYPQQTVAPIANLSPPVASGFVSKLNPSGTALVWSTFFSGSGNMATSNTWQDGDTITGMALDAAGNVVISGTAKSPNLPGVWNIPVADRPKLVAQQPSAGFVTRFTPDGVKLSPTELVAPPGNSVGANSLALAPGGSVVVAGPPTLVTLSNPPRVASITDTDNTRLVRVAPGQLLTLYGTKLSPARTDQPAGFFPNSFNGITITFNGTPAPILYASGDQVNLQVPFEIANAREVTMTATGDLGDPPFSESFILEVTARQPSVLLEPLNFANAIFGVDTCKGFWHCVQPLALNEDGTLNSPSDPAPFGSTVTIFLNGIGVTSPSLATGGVAGPLQSLSPGAELVCCSTQQAAIVNTQNIPGSSTTLAQVRIQVTVHGPMVFMPLQIDDGGSTFLLRGYSILIWTK